MEVTDVRIKAIDNQGSLKAVATITIDAVFVVHDLKVIDGEGGIFVAMPSKKAEDNKYRDIAHPINLETRQYIQSKVLEAYEKMME